MDETPANEPQSPDSSLNSKPRRKRTGRKRTVFRNTPRPAWPVKGLWEAAPEEERKKAHRTCMAILECWLGKKTKQQVAEDLSVSPLRVWQMSQQALSGMMAGLLPQPRRKVTEEAFEEPPGRLPRALLVRRIAQLETELARTEDLVRVLRMAPWTPSAQAETKERSRRVQKTRSTSTKRSTQQKTNATRSPRADRSAPPKGAPPEGRSGSAG